MLLCTAMTANIIITVIQKLPICGMQSTVLHLKRAQRLTERRETDQYLQQSSVSVDHGQRSSANWSRSTSDTGRRSNPSSDPAGCNSARSGLPALGSMNSCNPGTGRTAGPVRSRSATEQQHNNISQQTANILRK